MSNKGSKKIKSKSGIKKSKGKGKPDKLKLKNNKVIVPSNTSSSVDAYHKFLTEKSESRNKIKTSETKTNINGVNMSYIHQEIEKNINNFNDKLENLNFNKVSINENLFNNINKGFSSNPLDIFIIGDSTMIPSFNEIKDYDKELQFKDITNIENNPLTEYYKSFISGMAKN